MRSLSFRIHAVALATLATCSRLAAHAPDTWPHRRAPFDDTIARYHLPGIAVGVVEDGKVVYTAHRAASSSPAAAADHAPHAVQDRVEHASR